MYSRPLYVYRQEVLEMLKLAEFSKDIDSWNMWFSELQKINRMMEVNP